MMKTDNASLSRIVMFLAVALLLSSPSLGGLFTKSKSHNRGTASAKSTPASRAIEIVANRLRVPPSQLVAVSEVDLRPEGVTRVKVLHIPTGETQVVNLTVKNREVSDKQMQKLLTDRRGKGFKGKRDLDLSSKLDRDGPKGMTTVSVWLNTPGPPPRIDRRAEELGLADPQIERMRQFMKRTQLKATKFLAREGGKVEYVAEDAPLLVVTVPNRLIEQLERRGDVEALYLARDYELETDISTETIRANRVWRRGITGTGVKVAVVEPDGIAYTHPNLAAGHYFDPGIPNVDDHATHVAGIIASTHARFRGTAHGAPAVLSGNSLSFSTSALINATEWAINNGARVINYSFGVNASSSLVALDRYVDYLVRNRAVTVVKSAGNIGGTCFSPPYISSPGKGWNLITVGNFDDSDTGGNPPFWRDDFMANSSCYEDPASPNGDRQKPELAAPGIAITSTAANGGFLTLSGTSMSAPHVAGCAALLMDRNPTLKFWPEPVKAILMASAIHNIEGQSRLSERDGAGGIDCAAADDVVRFGWESHGSFRKSSFPMSLTLNANTGQRVRAVIVWDSTTDTVLPPTSDVLKADFDLYIYSPSGMYVTGSASWDNSYEIVEFRAPESGTYEVLIHPWRFEGVSEFLGFAYYKR